MSINVVGLHKDGVVLASDRRAMSRRIIREVDLDHYLGVFYDGIQKTFHLEPPHNWVGFIFHGNGVLDDGLFLENFQKALPNERLKVEEYAKRLHTFCRELYDSIEMPEEIDVSTHSTNLVIAGFDADEKLGKVFSITPEKSRISDEMFKGQTRSIVGGDPRFVKAATYSFTAKFVKSLVEKGYQAKKLGLNLSLRELTLLRILTGRRPEDIKGMLSFDEFVDSARHTITFTAKELIRLGEFPAVGEAHDVLKITAKEGAQFIEGKNTFEDILTFVDTGQNHIRVKCCGREVFFQIHIGKEYPPVARFVQYPDDGIFRCQGCGKAEDMDPILRSLKDDDDDFEEDEDN